MTTERDIEAKRIALRFQAACMAEAVAVPSPSEAADELFAALESVHKSGACGVVRDGLEAIRDLVEVLPRERRYVPMLIAAEALAACVVCSDEYQAVVKFWSEQPHVAPRTMAARACGRLADVDPSRVDVELLSQMTLRLDAGGAFDQKKVTLAHVAIAAAKLRDLSDGVRLIENLAELGSASRYVAALAIASDVAVGPPPCYLSVFADHAPRSNPPPRRLLGLMASLMEDPEALVRDAAVRAVQGMRQSWPETFGLLIDLGHGSDGSPPGTLSQRTPMLFGVQTQSAPCAPDLEIDETGAAHETITPAVRAALQDLNRRSNKTWTIAELPRLRRYELVQASPHARGVAYALGIAKRINDASGVLTWDPELLEEDLEIERDATFPSIKSVHRLFLSYRWSYAIDELGFIDFLAGTLFARGYDIVFDRDPRWREETLSAGDVLLLMFGCTHFVPVVTKELVAVLQGLEPADSALHAEWELARRLAGGPSSITWRGIWRSGDSLMAPLREEYMADLRISGFDALDQYFPERSFTVTMTTVKGERNSLKPCSRWELREAVGAARSTPDCGQLEIRDTTV